MNIKLDLFEGLVPQQYIVKKSLFYPKNQQNSKFPEIIEIGSLRLKGRNGSDVMQLRTDCVEGFNYPRSSAYLFSPSPPPPVNVGHCGSPSGSRVSVQLNGIGRVLFVQYYIVSHSLVHTGERPSKGSS